jgi:2,4-diaminopentanoate dehydrogenase
MPPRGVVIFGVGSVGQAVARLVLQRGWRLAAGINRSGPKIGRDLGLLAGQAEPLGIAVEDAAVVNLDRLDADIAVVAVDDRLARTRPLHRRLLEAGLNVVCSGGESSFPRAINGDAARELDAVARANGVTFTGCGLWDAYRLGTLRALAGPCTALRGLHHLSVVDVGRFGAETARLVGIGAVPGEGVGADAEPSIYRVLLQQAAASLGLTVEAMHERRERVVLTEPVPCPALGCVVEPGETAGSRSLLELSTREGVVVTGQLELRLTRPHEAERLGWTIDGDPPAELALSGLDTGHATASSITNRLPDVIAAPPGLVTVDQLAPMRCHLGRLDSAIEPRGVAG